MTDDFEAALRATGWRVEIHDGAASWVHVCRRVPACDLPSDYAAALVALYEAGREQGRRDQQASICQDSNLDCTPPDGDEDRYVALESVLYGRPEPCHCGFYNRERRHAPLGGGGDCPHWKEYRDED